MEMQFLENDGPQLDGGDTSDYIRREEAVAAVSAVKNSLMKSIDQRRRRRSSTSTPRGQRRDSSQSSGSNGTSTSSSSSSSSGSSGSSTKEKEPANEEDDDDVPLSNRQRSNNGTSLLRKKSNKKVEERKSSFTEVEVEAIEGESFPKRARRAKALAKAVIEWNGEEETEEDDMEEQVEVEEGSDEEESEEEEEEQIILESRLRHRNVDPARNEKKEQQFIRRKLMKISKKPLIERDTDEKALMKKYPKLRDQVAKNIKKQKTAVNRMQEIEDSPAALAKKGSVLAKAIQKSRHLIVYTGAGISTSANIPDYRGPNGVWTLLDQGKEVAACNLEQATPTYTHMSLVTLYKKGKLKHIVSQNCDALHMRSGIPRYAISEIHGNMLIEICKQCKPMRPFVRMFDVTERTNKHRHATLRRCYVCGSSLYDTIVHFGERGSLKWPINWNGATKGAEKADVILCLGSSLKVLRRYSWLWAMDRPKKQRPKLFVVNLQWTPKDSCATLKLNGKCDEVMRMVMDELSLTVPDYWKDNDPLLTIATELNPFEAHTRNKIDLIQKVKKELKEEEEESEEELNVEDEAQVKKEKDVIKVEDNAVKSDPEVLCALDALSKDHPYASQNLTVKKEEEETKEAASSDIKPEATIPVAEAAASSNGVRQSSRRPQRQCRGNVRYTDTSTATVNNTSNGGSTSSTRGRGRNGASSKGRLVGGNVSIDFRNIDWPRDALYLPYEPKFEYIEEGDTVGEDAFCCDCCDPATQRKRRGSQSGSDSEENDDDDEEEESGGGGVVNGEDSAPSDAESTTSSSTTNAGSSRTATPAATTPTGVLSQPGWFGKGRPKKR